MDGYRQYSFLKYRAGLRLKPPKIDGQIDDVVLGPERRSVAALRLLAWVVAAAFCSLLWWYRISHPDVSGFVDVVAKLGLALGLLACIGILVTIFDLIFPRRVPCLRVHLHFTGSEAGFLPERACVLHDGRMGQELLSPTVAAIAKELNVRVTVLRTDASIDKHRTTMCNC